MAGESLERTERGLALYGRLTDDRGSAVEVTESSAIGRPRCHVFTNSPIPDWPNPSPHLNAEQAEQLIALLQRFVAHAREADNWRNQKGYKDTFG